MRAARLAPRDENPHRLASVLPEMQLRPATALQVSLSCAASQPASSRAVERYSGACVIDELLQCVEEREVLRVIEHLRERLAQVQRARPVQVAQGQARSARDRAIRSSRRELLRRAAPMPGCRKIEAIDPGPELFVDRVGKLALPPEVERQIGIEIRRRGCSAMRLRVVPSKRNEICSQQTCFAPARLRWQCALIHARTCVCRCIAARSRSEQRAAGVLAGEFADEFGVLLAWPPAPSQ